MDVRSGNVYDLLRQTHNTIWDVKNDGSPKEIAMKILFVCSANVDRSPTAESIYSGRSDLEVKSAGVSDYARIPVCAELIQWADAVLCMEKRHILKIKKKFPGITTNKIIDSLDVPDVFPYMNNNLVNMLREKTDAWLHNYHMIKKG